MKNFKFKAGLAALALLLCGTSNSNLVSMDLNTAGDGLLTLDTQTGLKWLDVSETRGLSVNQVLAGNGG